MISRTACEARESGFTLLEMLIVLVLLALLAAILSGALFLGITARAHIDVAAKDQADFAAFEQIVMNQLSRAYPDWVKVGQSQGIDFAGGPDYISFLAPAVMAQGQGLAEYRLSVTKQNGHNVLLLRSVLSSSSSAKTLVTSFAPGLKSVKFSYFGPTRDDHQLAWQSDWVMQPTPPDLIRIAVIFPPGDGHSWPVLIIHPEITADATCEIDASTHRCLGR